MRRAPALLLLALAGMACNPTYAPPVWSVHYGAPGRPLSGRGQAAFNTNRHLTGGPGATFHVVQGLQLEAGTESMFVHSGEGWILGRVGARYTFNRRAVLDGRPQGRGWAFDLEAGGGFGAGGEHRDDPKEAYEDCDDPQDRLAGGLYVGGGVGYHVFRWLAFFARAREQFTRADGIPWTFWTTAVAGPEFTFGPAHLHLAAGYFRYDNSADAEQDWILEGGIAFRFDYKDD